MKISDSVRHSLRPATRPLAALLLLAALAPTTPAQSLNGFEKKRAQSMLDQVMEDIRKNYYDPQFHGVDVDATFKAAGEKLKNAVTNGQAMGIIAQAVMELNDSHTFFIPPQRQVNIDYGFQMMMVGDECYVSEVTKGSDAEAKGLKVGDRVVLFDQFQPARENFWKLLYLYYALRPQPGVRLTALGPDDAQPRQIDVIAKMTDRKRLDLSNYSDYMELVRAGEKAERARVHGHRFAEVGEELLIWKMPAFDLSPDEVDAAMTKAGKFKSLIIDLRGNGGGDELTLLRLLGNFFDHDLTVGEVLTRKESKPLVAKARGGKTYQGKVVVLVDAESASSSEVFARAMQLQKRGTVVGDRSAGAVMRAREYSHAVGIDTVTFYAAQITDADLKMTDGRSLERAGVVPDETRLPNGADLAAKRDPVLAYAASLAGVELNAEKAGALFPDPKK
ncbi:MAG: S41 family peptidase [Pyrinomonadaceae bacterium]